MSREFSFKFLDDRLNRRLVALLKKSRIPHSVDAEGTIRYSPANEEVVEHELIKSIRDQIFAAPWQIISCPREWIGRYKSYMAAHRIPFIEEQIDGDSRFLLPRKYRPHSWKLPDDRVVQRRHVAVG